MGADLSQLSQFLQQQRWFGSKGIPIKQVALIEQADFPVASDAACPGGVFSIAIAEVTYDLGTPERYQLLVCRRPDGTVTPALQQDAIARELLRLIRGNLSIPSGSGRIRGESFPEFRAVVEKLSASPSIRRMEVEQSNSSVVFDERAILKVIRKIEAGVNPELEMGRFLATHPGFKWAPALLGAIFLEGPVEATLAVLHQFIPAESDAWKYTLGVFRDRPRLPPAFLDEVKKLGSVLGQLHLVLASEPNDPAFTPEPIQKEDLQRWSSSIIGEIGVTVAAATRAIPELADRRDALVERARKLAKIAPSGKKIRGHGDLHLGQVLRSRGEWFIFDFEGEPARSFNQRREKHTPLKDVAGMLRSFAYAAAAVELEGAAPGERAFACRDAFLDGYLRTTKSSGLLPEGEEGFRVTLEALELERSVYELRYELQSRPDWVRIPARTLLDMGMAS